MDRKTVLWTAGAVAGAAVAGLWWWQQRNAEVRKTPAWTDPQQPVAGTGGQEAVGLPAVASPTASWNAMRPGSPRLMAGSVIHRVYAPTLVDDPESLVR